MRMSEEEEIPGIQTGSLARSETESELERARSAFSRGDHGLAQMLCAQWRDRWHEAPDAAYMQGVMEIRAGRPQDAIALLQAATRHQPRANYFGDLGVAFDLCGRSKEAETAYKRALELKPDYPEAHNNLGMVLAARGDTDAAFDCYQRAITLRPDFADAHHNLGLLHAHLNRLVDAEVSLRQAVALRPDHADTLNSLGLVLERRGQVEEAEQLLQRLVSQYPGHAVGHNNLANFLMARGRLEESESQLHQALAQSPDYLDAQYNLGLVLSLQDAHLESERAYRRALALDPDCHAARWNLALLLLTCGQFDEGWQFYETRYEPRWAKAPVRRPSFSNGPSMIQWMGESLEGKSLLLLPEQGYGDCIQFARYAPLIAQQYGPRRLTIGCPKALVPLMQTLDGIDQVIEFAQFQTQIPHHDYWSLLGSLPLRMGTQRHAIPASVPYLRAQHTRFEIWSARLPVRDRSAHRAPRIGLVWKGSDSHPNDARRSLPHLALLRPLWSAGDAHFISLQKGQGEDEASVGLPGCPMLHLGSDIGDFADTAAIVAQLDLVITVDTALAHVAGALGKPCWVLLPRQGTDWRWLTHRRESPWYPTLQLFRQKDPEKWETTIDSLTQALRTWLRAGKD